MKNARTPYVLPAEKADSVFRDAMKLARAIYIDELDCSKSFSRISSNKTYDEIMEIAEKYHSLYHFIYRDMSFLPQEFEDANGLNLNRDYWDVGFTTISSKPDYFLFIELEIEDGFDLIKKYKLKEKR